MRINLNFTNKGQAAIQNFNDEELIEIFSRYSNTLMKKYTIEISVPEDMNQNIVEKGTMILTVENAKCDVETFFKELARDVKVPLKKRLSSTDKLDNVYKLEIIE